MPDQRQRIARAIFGASGFPEAWPDAGTIHELYMHRADAVLSDEGIGPLLKAAEAMAEWMDGRPVCQPLVDDYRRAAGCVGERDA
jgi:hypothetical protein